MGSGEDILTNIRFAMQVLGDSQRTIVCEPELESRLKCLVDAMGLGGVITVNASRACPPGQFIIMDERALEAANNQALQRDLKDWRL